MATLLLARRAKKSDCAQVAAIVRHCFAPLAKKLSITKESYPDYVAFEQKEGVKKELKQGALCYLFYLGDQPVGTVRIKMSKKTAEIFRLGVLPAFRGQDFGRQIMSFAHGLVQGMGAKKAELSIVAKFRGLEHFYTQLGYVKTVEQTFAGLPFSVAFLEKTL